MKSEHNGAKNGGGHWGKRAEAKKKSKKQRRKDDKPKYTDRPQDYMSLYDYCSIYT